MLFSRTWIFVNADFMWLLLYKSLIMKNVDFIFN